MTTPTDDPLERLLATALRDARTDDRWAVPTAPGLAHRVRRATVRRRRQRALVAVTAGLALVGGGTAVLAQARGGGAADSVYARPTTTSPAAAPSPVAGVSPDYLVDEGSDWLLSRDDYVDFFTTHSMPSPRPNPVQSPAPLTGASARLLADVESVLPDGATTDRQDALDGDPARVGVHVRLADGTPVEVEREPLQTPIAYLGVGGSGSIGSGVSAVQDVPGSASAFVVFPGISYGWGPGVEHGARRVLVVRPDGEATSWYAPLSVPVETVTQWALGADAAGR